MDPAAQQDSARCPSQPTSPGILSFAVAIVAAAYGLPVLVQDRFCVAFGPGALVPESWGFTTNVAMAWPPDRSKTLELVRQREALTARVQVTQMSMISS
ncbi:uncharacterized protein LY79DRAFT_666885 [Colletotrichum navitas]|uniref:Uncharacterized protein n=1 Tax=Colletotrichum navitas TaxID=681940 RepID=A0AAD8VA68_9PEZI|nr:uncharacterized protein LY79DRAFT_666885 [Colletotrichum navitas]KAK1597140.1 hypothetical protein LY79DRAFT_666885 [Colletotrichum navitas]